MSILSSLGNRALQTLTGPTPSTAGTAHAGKSGRSHHASASGSASGDDSSDSGAASGSVSLSTDSILQNRAASLGSATVDYAQNLLTSFTQQVLGDAAKGDTVSFDSVSLDTSSSFAEAAQHTSGANGTTDSLAAGLSDSSHFIGKGTITTTDGRKFDFEIEVQYDDKIEAGVSQGSDATGGATAGGASGAAAPANSADSAGTVPAQSGAQSADSTGTPAASSSDTGALPTIQLPNIDFGGGLADLFQLIGRQLQTSVPQSSGSNSSASSDGSSGGSATPATGAASSASDNPFKTLSLRLLKLVDSIKDADTYAPTSSAGTSNNAKSLANTYGTTASNAGNNAAAGAAAPAAAGTAANNAAAATPASGTASNASAPTTTA